jgi:hypothetical protein
VEELEPHFRVLLSAIFQGFTRGVSNRVETCGGRKQKCGLSWWIAIPPSSIALSFVDFSAFKSYCHILNIYYNFLLCSVVSAGLDFEERKSSPSGPAKIVFVFCVLCRRDPYSILFGRFLQITRRVVERRSIHFYQNAFS